MRTSSLAAKRREPPSRPAVQLPFWSGQKLTPSHLQSRIGASKQLKLQLHRHRCSQPIANRPRPHQKTQPREPLTAANNGAESMQSCLMRADGANPLRPASQPATRCVRLNKLSLTFGIFVDSLVFRLHQIHDGMCISKETRLL